MRPGEAMRKSRRRAAAVERFHAPSFALRFAFCAAFPFAPLRRAASRYASVSRWQFDACCEYVAQRQLSGQ